MTSITIGEVFNKKIGYIALQGFLVMLAMVSLAACGGAAATPTTAPVPPTATTAAIEAPQPEATPTAIMEEIDSMDDMEGMEEATPTTAAQVTPTAATDGAATDQATPTTTPAAEDSNGSAGTATTTINAVLKEWAIDMDQTEVPAGVINFSVTNEGRMQHNLTVLDSSGATLGATPNFSGSAGAQPLEVTLAPGTYTIVCSLPGHATRGQKTVLVVK